MYSKVEITFIAIFITITYIIVVIFITTMINIQTIKLIYRFIQIEASLEEKNGVACSNHSYSILLF